MKRKIITTMDELYALLNEADKVLVTGYPGAGKTTLSKKLFTDHKIIHTDDFLHLPHEAIPNAILSALPNKALIEGTHATRLLSRGYQPDLLIMVFGSQRDDCHGIRKMIDNHLKNYPDTIIKLNPRLLK